MKPNFEYTWQGRSCPSGTCPNCGGPLLGDGYRTVLHCERVDAEGVEPDAKPVFCEPETISPV